MLELPDTPCPEPDEAASPFPAELPHSATVEAGAIAGSFGVTSTGEATYTIPLVVPPGRAGMQPELAVQYDSASGEGVLGMGFSVTGLSAVTRCPRNLAQDGEIRAVRYDEGDALCLDGKRLVEVGGGGEVVEYRTVPDTFARVVASYEGGWDRARGPKRLRVFTRAGRVLEYGGEPSGQVLAKGGVIRAWWATRVSDRSGNTIDFHYQNETSASEGYTVEHAPRRIEYTGHPRAAATRAIEFVYAPRRPGTGRVLYSRGMALRSSQQLDRIRMLGPGGALVREYRFSYTSGPATGRRLLNAVRECAADGRCKPATRFRWHHGTGPGFAEVGTRLRVPESERGSLMTMDATGDGRDDLVTTDLDLPVDDDNPITNFFVAPNRMAEGGSSSFGALALAHQEMHHAPPSPVQPELGTPIDYNDDGRMDIFLHDVHGRYPDWHVLLATPEGTFRRKSTGIRRKFGIDAPPPLDLNSRNASAHLADVDGDGIADLLQCEDTGSVFTDWTLHLWRPAASGFEPEPSRIPALRGHPCNAETHLADVDSDGKVDLLVYEATITGNGTLFGTTFEALSFVRPGEWTKRATGLPVLKAGSGGRVIVLDVNGDGLPDAVETGFDDGQLRTFINTGDGFAAGVSSLPSFVFDADAFAKLAAPIDHNSDGRQDLLMPIREPGGPVLWKILQATGSTGDGTFAVIDARLPVSEVLVDREITLAHPWAPRVTDVDGDGNQDVVLAVGKELRVFRSRLREEDLLWTVSDGMSAYDPEEAGHVPKVQIEYSHLSAAEPGVRGEQRTYLPRYDTGEPGDGACDYPVRCALGPRRVVSRYAVNNGADRLRTFQVAYRNGKYHRLGRGFLGFGVRIVRDAASGAGSAEFFDNVTFDPSDRSFPLAGHVVREWRWTPEPQQKGVSRVELSYTERLIHAILTNRGKSYFTLPVYQKQRREQGEHRRDSGKTLEEYVRDTWYAPTQVVSRTERLVSAWDAFGNIREESTSTAGVDLTLKVKRTFRNDEDAWLIGLLETQQECSRALSIEQCRTSSRAYDRHGRVRTESAGSDDDDPETVVRVRYTRDAFGNVIHTRAEDAFGGRRKACVSYDAEGVFPYAQRNPEGHVTYTRYDAGHGALEAVVDPNGLATQWAHDGLGRITEERRPDGTTTRATLSRTRDGGPRGDAWRVLRRTATDGGADETVELDGFGRPIRGWAYKARTDDGPAERVVQEIAFDQSGERVARRSLPAAEGTPRERMQVETYGHDATGRIAWHRAAWGAETRYRYLGRTVEVEGPGGRVTTIENDALGRPVRIVDPEGGVTSYAYGPFGGLWTVTDPGDAKTTTERDAYGRVRRHIDPDRGTAVAHYDGFGQQTSTVDALGREVSWKHDRLGRAVERSDEDGTTTWTWDEAEHGVGKLAEVASPEGHRTTYRYDALGRLREEELAIEGERFATTVDYDGHSRPFRLWYPQAEGERRFGVRRIFDAHGHLVGLRNERSREMFWRLEDTDEAGRIRIEEFGNGVTTERSYHETKGRLRRVATMKDHVVLQDLWYGYDDRLNLSSRRDDRLERTEHFRYDKLDRLTCAARHERFCLFETTYAPNGNIREKPDVGEYTYDPEHPHAVRTAGADVFAYDAVGNQVRRPGVEEIRYTAFDLPASITLAGGTGTVDLDYDGDQRRIRKTTPMEQTVYAGDLYERVTDLATGVVEHRYTVRSSERAVAVVTKRAGGEARTLYIHVDHLGSVDLLTEGRGEDAGREVERRSYDAFGARRDPVTWRRAPKAEAPPALLARGFTGHGSDDELGLVHMKGRLYDPKIGRFTTPDPVVSRPLFGQSWNAYSYVLNNPLAYVDPSGFQEAVPEDRGGSSRAAGAEFTSDELGLPPIEELVVARFPEHEARSDADANAMGAEVGGAVPPVDVGVYGTSAGFVPQPGPSSPEHASAASVVGEGLLGAGEGTGELALRVARSLVLSALTFGGYGTYELGRAMWDGYKENGVVGALNAVNPLYQIGRGAADTALAIDRDDYRAAGAAGVKTVIIGAATVFGAGRGLGALEEATTAAGIARGAPSLPVYTGGKTTGVLRTATGDMPLVSGYKGPSASMPRGTPGMNGRIKSHVEAHAAAVMRERGIKDATLHINQVPCSSATGCGAMLPRMLPEGAQLRVLGPDGYDQVFIGLPD
ncbi:MULTISPECIES: FG-GAP-like repeat-containing protein [Sorangium]|uniref:FG-GAP-like repeat-containing protein n=1 Tax=Sorangium TaxID=39643 RepID=UPI001A923965|nr:MULTISPECIES: FG-GAP-like repeat-containing protein [Sorangium]